jgi:proline iminopeptidase
MAVPCTTHDGLAIYRFGEGVPILLMPGPHRFARPGLRATDALIDGLAALGRTVITFDPPGSGRSTRAAHLSMQEMLDCADESLDVSGVSGSVDAVGHSMSGLAVLAYAIERPQRVGRLVLIGTGSGGPSYLRAKGAVWNRTHPHFWRLAALGILHIIWPRLGPERLLNNFIQRESFVDPHLVEPRTITAGDWLRPREGRTDWHRVARRTDYTPRLARIRVPTLILCGRHDPQFPPTCSEDLSRHITSAEAIFFERSGHYPFIEEPDAFWSAVAHFLSDPERGVLASSAVDRQDGSSAIARA